MKQKLLVLPGAADPAVPSAQGRYKLVIEEALRRGYEAPQVVACTGQVSAGGESMDLTSATAQLAKLIMTLESEGSSYDVIAFSWGATLIRTLFALVSVRMTANRRPRLQAT